MCASCCWPRRRSARRRHPSSGQDQQGHRHGSWQGEGSKPRLQAPGCGGDQPGHQQRPREGADLVEGRADALSMGAPKSLDEEIAELASAEKVDAALAALKARAANREA